MNLVPIKDIAKIHYGKALKKDDRVESGSVNVFGSNGAVGNHDEFLFVEPTVIIGRKGSVGKTIYTEEKSWTIDTAFYSEIDKDKVDIKYFHYALTAKDMEQYAITTSIPGINRNDIYDLKIPLPSLSEQKAIVAKLERAQRLIDIDRQMLAKYDELIQSVFLEMFGDPVRNEKGWEKIPFKKIAEIDKNSFDPTNFKGSVEYVGLNSIVKGSGKIIDVEAIMEGDVKSNKYRFTPNHILYGKLRPYLNKVAFPEFTGVCSTDILPIKPIQKFSTKLFLGYLMKTDEFLSYADKNSTGANLPRISPKMINKFSAILPPYELQLKFSDVIKKIEVEKRFINVSLKKSEELFSSLVQRTFN